MTAATPATDRATPSTCCGLALFKAPEYFELDDVPGIRLFACGPLAMNMQAASCAERWSASRRTTDHRYDKCRGCPVGAFHAGEENPSASAFYGQRICARCHHLAERFIFSHLCVSCYNREREIKLGRNGKGKPPVRLVALQPHSIVYSADGIVHRRKFSFCSSATEAILSVLRDCKHAVMFGFFGQPRLDYGAAA